MYVKYAWNAGASKTQVLADLVAIITNTAPDIGILSASCDKVNTEILANEELSNWSVHDANAAADRIVLKSVNYDEQTFKYVDIEVDATPYIKLMGAEAWNAAAHSGTNIAFLGGDNTLGSSANAVSVSFVNPGHVYIFATSRYLAIVNSPIYGYTFNLIGEFSRDGFGVDITYPNIFTACYGTNCSTGAVLSIGSSFGTSRVKRASAAGDQPNSPAANMVTPVLAGTNPSSFNQNVGIRGIGEITHYLILPILLAATPLVTYNETMVQYLGEVLGGIKCMPSGTDSTNTLDEILNGGVTYVQIKASAGTRLLLPRK